MLKEPIVKLDVSKAATMMQDGNIRKSYSHGGMIVTLLSFEGKEFTLIQGSGDDFLMCQN